MTIIKPLVIILLISFCSIINASNQLSEQAMDNELKNQKAFLRSLFKIYHVSEVKSKIAQVIRPGDDFKQHRAFLSLANRTVYLPYQKEFRFTFYRGNKFEEGYWQIDIHVDEDLKVTHVDIQMLKS